MKRLVILFVILLVTGCQLSGMPTTTETPATYWLNYHPTQCNTPPWGDTLEEVSIINYYQTVLGVTVQAVEVTAPSAGFISCSACGCLTGSQVSIQTDAAGKIILAEHGFIEEELGPELITNVDDDAVIQPLDTDPFTDSAAETADFITEEENLSATDQSLQTRAEQLRTELQLYYTQHGSYPDVLTGLKTTVDTTGLVYTPIGVTPADYYDLVVAYSTGRVILNP